MARFFRIALGVSRRSQAQADGRSGLRLLHSGGLCGHPRTRQPLRRRTDGSLEDAARICKAARSSALSQKSRTPKVRRRGKSENPRTHGPSNPRTLSN
jgi:hypothetical protein